MIGTRLCSLLGIERPILLGGMSGATNPELVAAVSNAGGLGILGLGHRPPEEVQGLIAEVRARTDRPFGVNFLLAFLQPKSLEAALAERVPVLSLAWGDPVPHIPAAKAAGCTVVHMVPDVAQAQRAAGAGADVIVAQGSDGGGHIGPLPTLALVPQVVDAVAPLPVVAAGGISDGRGLAAVLALGAEGALLGTRFLATVEAPIPDVWKQALLGARADDTVFTQIPDLASESRWPGASTRVLRNRFIETWLGREEELRRLGREIGRQVAAAEKAGEREGMVMYAGAGCGLIQAIQPAGEVVRTICREAEAVIRERLLGLVGG